MPLKSPRTGPPPRSRSSKNLEAQAQSRAGEDEGKARETKEVQHSSSLPRQSSSLSSKLRHRQVASTAVGHDNAGLETMRKKMSEALAQKQQNMAAVADATPPSAEADESANPLTNVESSSDGSFASAKISTDSAGTVKASAMPTPNAVRTPSYPFPRMQLRLNRGTSHRSGPSHKPFTLLSPTNEPVLGSRPPNSQMSEGQSSELSTPLGQAFPTNQGGPNDPDYPAPDLYDTILMLNAEPGLEMWWANVTDILSESYGAERASLALPGDITDLENVPWGQKATFNLHGSESGGMSMFDSLAASEPDARSVGRPFEAPSVTAQTASPLAHRPMLQSRHSIAGVLPGITKPAALRPTGPVRAISSMGPQDDEQQIVDLPRLTKRGPTPRTEPSIELEIPRQVDHGSEPSNLRCHVHRSLQPLESEEDPLLVRSGVAPLFGKRKPVVLTRAYSEEPAPPSPRPQSAFASDDGRSSVAKASEQQKMQTKEEFGSLIRPIRAVDEYEQPEPSPWSQSPSPSPAARSDPSESPFFSQSNAVDERAFEQNPPAYDYATSANQPLGAIGAEMSQSLIHIPLIQPVPSRGVMATSLRFPIALVSYLSPFTPYPKSLRQSLTALLPHLASSFSLAQQYSSLQDRSRGATSNRPNHGFGLGGTFSDEGSELELVAELSGQIAEEKERSRGIGRRDNMHGSYQDRRGIIRESPSSSVAGTPLHEHIGMSPGLPSTPGRSGAELFEGYFSAKRPKQSARTPGEDVSSKSKGSHERSSGAGKISSKKALASSGRPINEFAPPLSPRPGSQTSESEYGDVSEALDRLEHGLRRTSQHHDRAKDENEKPLPELISSLMLNAVPLQLFLAKPGSGDLVWTNRKFDAFRSQGEGRVRDPWKNVHEADRSGLAKLWNKALISGSQFTHYIRVKRFNSDSDFRWFVFRASTLLSNNGRLLYWIGSFLDVHEQYIKNLEANEKEASMARDAKIRALADAIPQVLFEALEGEGIVSVNQQWVAYSGQSMDEARGLGFARHVYREDLPKCGILSSSDAAALSQEMSSRTDSNSSSSSNKTAAPVLQKNLFAPDRQSLTYMIQHGSVTVEKDENGRTSYLTEIRLRSRGGEYRWFLVRLVRVNSSMLGHGRASWYGTCTDIETRKALEKELNSANQKVHSEMEGKTKFFANMSHEIRTPLNGILGSMPWLVESALDHDQRRTVDTIQNSANNLRELVDNILDVTKVEAGKMTLLPRWFHVRTLCEEVVDTVSSRAIERGLELNYSLDTKVPTNVKADPFRVRQVLLNLLGNSVKFTEQGEVYMACTLREDPTSTSTEAPTALLAFKVIDTGRGFNENEFQRLFKQFGQLGSGSNHEAGSGLGLFLSKQLVEMHGGELTVKSQAGEGSIFSFYIRVEIALPGQEVQSPQPVGISARHRQRSSISGSSRSQSDTKMPTLAGKGTESGQGVIQTPGLSRYVASPGTQSPSQGVTSPPTVSPPILSTGSSAPSVRSNSVSNIVPSSISSFVATPDSLLAKDGPTGPSEREVLVEKAVASHPLSRRSKSDNDGSGLAPDFSHPATYSIVIICPAEHARAAIKQHIEHVVPLQIPTNVTTLADIGSFLDLMSSPASPSFSHIVLDLPASSDIMLFMRQLTNFTAAVIPSLVVVTDHYQKRDIQDDFQALLSSGRKAYLIHKPVKPSVFALIFDPAQLRNLSRDRQREVAQTTTDDFRNVANMVKETVGNRSLRILLVEDSDVNRMVIARYMKKVALDYEEAKDGQEGLDKVFGNGHGHYSMIICDIQMPRKNGYEACMEIRQWERENGFAPMPIMALTANAMPEERSAAAAAGFSDYLTKPVDFQVLGPMLIALLDSKVAHVYLRDRPTES
jgi:signal transduction histidine kinase/CheY-like chemotaxis protein